MANFFDDIHPAEWLFPPVAMVHGAGKWLSGAVGNPLRGWNAFGTGFGAGAAGAGGVLGFGGAGAGAAGVDTLGILSAGLNYGGGASGAGGLGSGVASMNQPAAYGGPLGSMPAVGAAAPAGGVYGGGGIPIELPSGASSLPAASDATAAGGGISPRFTRELGLLMQGFGSAIHEDEQMKRAESMRPGASVSYPLGFSGSYTPRTLGDLAMIPTMRV